MEVVSTCPLRVASMVWEPWTSGAALTVVCKATFQLQPGVAELLEEQEEPLRADAHWNGDEARSLCAPADLVPFKVRADVILVGRAFAPGGQPVRSLLARLSVGEIDKTIEIFCDRGFFHDGRVLEGQPFATMPLHYERAAGGPATSNPVGIRFDAPPDATGTMRIPNLQPPGTRVSRRGDTFEPIGFGAIAPRWPARAQKLPPKAADWSLGSGQRMPGGIDPAYFNAAPRDQQAESIGPEERIVLENLHPELPRLVTRLPGLRPRALVMAGGRVREEVALLGDTLWINTVRGVASVVWRGCVALRQPDEEGRVVVSMVGPGAEGAWSDARVDAGLPPSGRGDMQATAQLGPGGLWEAPSGVAPVRMVETMPSGPASGPALPFERATSPWADVPLRPAPERPKGSPSGTRETMLAPNVQAREVLPFVAHAPYPPGPLSPDFGGKGPGDRGPGQPARNFGDVVPEVPEPPATPDEAPPSIEAYPIGRCARIAAELARRPEESEAILKAQELSHETWTALHERWLGEIRAEAGRGKTFLLSAYDGAYVGQLEKERGIIGAPEYARLVIAAERGQGEAMLEAMGLPQGALIRIRRVWLLRLVKDANAAAEVRAAMRAAGEELTDR